MRLCLHVLLLLIGAITLGNAGAQEFNWKAIVEAESAKLIQRLSEAGADRKLEPELQAICSDPSYEGAPSSTFSAGLPTADDLARAAMVQSMTMALQRQYRLSGSIGESQKAVAEVLKNHGCDVAAVGAVSKERWVRSDAFSETSSGDETDEMSEWVQADQSVKVLLFAAEYGQKADPTKLSDLPMDESEIAEATSALRYVKYGTECAAVLSEVEVLCTGENSAFRSFLAQTSDVDPELAEGGLFGVLSEARKGIPLYVLIKALTPDETAGPDKDQFTQAELRQQFEDRVDRGIREIREAAKDATDKAPSMRTDADIILITLTEETVKKLEEYKEDPGSFKEDPNAPQPIPAPDENSPELTDAFEGYKRNTWDPQLKNLLDRRLQCLALSDEYSEPIHMPPSTPTDSQCDVAAAARELQESSLPRTNEGTVDYDRMTKEVQAAKVREEKRFLASDDWQCDYDRFSQPECDEAENEFYVRQGYSGTEEFCMLHPLATSCQMKQAMSAADIAVQEGPQEPEVDNSSEGVFAKCPEEFQQDLTRAVALDCPVGPSQGG